MPKLNSEAIFLWILIATLALSSLALGYSVYLEVSKWDVPERHKAFYMGLATLFTFTAGFLFHVC